MSRFLFLNSLVEKKMEAALVPTLQIWDKGKSTFILIVIGVLLVYVTPQNRLTVLIGSILILSAAQYCKTLCSSLQYESFRVQLTNLAGFCTTGATILLLSVFGRVFTDFIAESGGISVERLYKIIVIIAMFITIYGFIPSYLWLYNVPHLKEE